MHLCACTMAPPPCAAPRCTCAVCDPLARSCSGVAPSLACHISKQQSVSQSVRHLHQVSLCRAARHQVRRDACRLQPLRVCDLDAWAGEQRVAGRPLRMSWVLGAQPV